MNVVIVGGGVMGCSVALKLQQAGAHATVLERAIPGAEASSAAAGILAPQSEAHGPGPFLDLCLRSRGMYRAFVDELRELSGIDVGFALSGALHAAFSEGAAHHLEAQVSWQQACSLRAQLLTGAEARAIEPNLSPEAVAAAHFPDDAQVDNKLLMRALSMAAARSGARFKSGHVRSLAVEGGRAVGVDLDGEIERADAVVIAAGSWSGLIQGVALDPRVIKPARGQMIELQTRLPVAGNVLFGEHGYLVPRSDGRVIAGTTVELVGFEKQVTAAGLSCILNLTLQLCPSLKDAPVQSVWAGLRPWTEDQLPILGEGPLPGLFLATGHFRNGILLTPVTAKLVSQSILGQKPSVDLKPFHFGRFSPHSPKSSRPT
jgi:glycine oxidase